MQIKMCIMLHVHVHYMSTLIHVHATCMTIQVHIVAHSQAHSDSIVVRDLKRCSTLPSFLIHSNAHRHRHKCTLFLVRSKRDDVTLPPPPPSPPLITCSTPLMSNYYIQYLYSISCTCTSTCSGSPVVVNYCMCIHRCMDRQTFIPSGK